MWKLIGYEGIDYDLARCIRKMMITSEVLVVGSVSDESSDIKYKTSVSNRLTLMSTLYLRHTYFSNVDVYGSFNTALIHGLK